MTVEADIYNALKGLVADRVYPANDVPVGVSRPYVTWQQTGGVAVNFMEATTPSIRNARIQINCWADTRLAVSSISRQVEAAMITALKAHVLGALIAVKEIDTGLKGTMQDFSIWSEF